MSRWLRFAPLVLLLLVVGALAWRLAYPSDEKIRSRLAGPNWTAIEAEVSASRGGGVVILRPQSRFFPEPPTTTSEAAIDTVWNGQLYVVLGEQGIDGRWQLRAWWKPFVTLIWFGGMLIALGGALALFGRAWRARRQRRLVEEGEL